MHELSLIQELLQMIMESARIHNIRRVHHVRLVVGEWYGALPCALRFAFEALTRHTICCGAVLEIASLPIRYKCRECEGEFEFMDNCPICASRDIYISQGRELYIDYYEGE